MITYYAVLRYPLTGNTVRVEFPTPQARALQIVALGGYVRVLEEGEATS